MHKGKVWHELPSVENYPLTFVSPAGVYPLIGINSTGIPRPFHRLLSSSPSSPFSRGSGGKGCSERRAVRAPSPPLTVLAGPVAAPCLARYQAVKPLSPLSTNARAISVSR